MIILVISSYILIKDFLQFKESDNSSKELIDTVITQEDNDDELKMDWEKLEDINKDIIGWIKIDNTNINYPILKDNDDLKYLKHSFDGKYNKNGSIFTLNNNPFYDNVTTIYGHNMKNSIMFSELSKYINKNFFETHKYYEIYTKSQNYIATIFSFYSIDQNKEENNIKWLSFNEKIEYYKKKSIMDIKYNIDKTKKIVKLSTCSYLNNHTTPTEKRYYVVAMLEKCN